MRRTMPSTKLQRTSINGSKCLSWVTKSWCFCLGRDFLWALIASYNPKSIAYTRLSRRLKITLMWWRCLIVWGISKMFNVADFYPYYSSDEPLYLEVPANSRSSFSQVGETNAEEMTLEYMEKRDHS